MIYFVRSYCKKFIKIGTTENLQRRLKELQSANPLPLKLLAVIDGSYQSEAGLHEIFAKQRVQGSEWFRNQGDVKALQKVLTNPAQHPFSNLRELQRVIHELRIREAANRQKSGKTKAKIRSITNNN